jgi:2-haloacid dehalogenase
MKPHSNQPSAIIFDIGGVLLDWNARHLYEKLFDNPAEMDRFLTEIDFQSWNLELDRGSFTFAENVAALSHKFPHYANLIRAFDERWAETISGPIQATIEILQTLKEQGYGLYGLTNWSAEKYEITRHKYPFFGLFDDIVVSGMVKLVKPDPRIFALALEKARRPAAECVLIDDSETNVTAACHLGLKTIHFKSAEQLETELSHLGILSGKCAKSKNEQ